MIQLVILGGLIGRSGKAFNTASFAGALMLLLNPWLFWDVGWRLSMLAVLSITSLSSADLSGEAKFFLICPLVWLATTLQAAWTFGESPIVGIVANFFALPAFAALFPLSAALSMPSLMGLPFGSALVSIPEFLFVRWERFSLNLLALCPWRLSFSVPLLIVGSAILSYFFARASGFGKQRAVFATCVNMLGLCALLYAR
jgi:competence protein ComEC